MIVDALLPWAGETPAPSDDFWYTPLHGGGEVTPDTAIQTAAVMACVRVLAETVGQLPLHLMRETGRKKEKAVEEPLYEVLHNRPNDWQTPFEFREMQQGHLALRGNAYAQIRPGARGAVDQLVPLHPDRMQVFRLVNGRIAYLYQDERGRQYRLTQDEVFHLRFMSLNDCVGMSVITACAKAVELAQQGETHGVNFYRNAARPSGVLTLPAEHPPLDEDALKRLRKSWRDAHTGDDLFTTAVLEGGVSWQQLAISNEDSEWLDGRRFQINEIARLFRVPPHMIGSAIEHGMTYANVEQSDLAFLKHTMLPWLVRWEQAIGRDLVVQPEPAGGTRLYAKFAVEGLLRADSTTRAQFYSTMLSAKVYTRNEVRELEDMNPIEGGDEIDEPAPPPQFAPPEPGRDEEDDEDDDRKGIVRAWVADCATRLANHEIGVLASRVDKAAKDRTRFNTFVTQHWQGTFLEYFDRTVSRLFTSCRPRVSSECLAGEIAGSAVAHLVTYDPSDVLARWKKTRAADLAAKLSDALEENDGQDDP